MKKVGTCYYSHTSALHFMVTHLNIGYEYFKACYHFARIRKENNLRNNFATVIKYDTKTGNTTFINCPDFDTIHEPIVGDAYCVHPDGTYKFTKGGTKVYHHKHLFVSPDYQGFNVPLEKVRAYTLENFSDFPKKSIIGNVKVWHNFLDRNHLEH